MYDSEASTSRLLLNAIMKTSEPSLLAFLLVIYEPKTYNSATVKMSHHIQSILTTKFVSIMATNSVLKLVCEAINQYFMHITYKLVIASLCELKVGQLLPFVYAANLEYAAIHNINKMRCANLIMAGLQNLKDNISKTKLEQDVQSKLLAASKKSGTDDDVTSVKSAEVAVVKAKQPSKPRRASVATAGKQLPDASIKEYYLQKQQEIKKKKKAHSEKTEEEDDLSTVEPDQAPKKLPSTKPTAAASGRKRRVSSAGATPVRVAGMKKTTKKNTVSSSNNNVVHASSIISKKYTKNTTNDDDDDGGDSNESSIGESNSEPEREMVTSAAESMYSAQQRYSKVGNAYKLGSAGFELNDVSGAEDDRRQPVVGKFGIKRR